MERRSSREVRESFFGGENSRGTRGPARRRGRGDPWAGAGTLLGREGADPGLLGGDRPTKDPWGARPRGPPRPRSLPGATSAPLFSGEPPPPSQAPARSCSRPPGPGPAQPGSPVPSPPPSQGPSPRPSPSHSLCTWPGAGQANLASRAGSGTTRIGWSDSLR